MLAPGRANRNGMVAMTMERARWSNVFATPMLAHVWTEGAALNPALRDTILRHAASEAGETLTNFGGWHSATGLLEFCGEAGQRLIRMMHAMTQEATHRLYTEFERPIEPLSWTLSAWANVNRAGDYNSMHTHPGATWSGVYYVDDGEADGSAEATAIQLADPNPARTSLFFPELSSQTVQFRPQPGLMILFPSYVPHTVPPHRGPRPRISIAFNVRKDPFP